VDIILTAKTVTIQQHPVFPFRMAPHPSGNLDPTYTGSRISIHTNTLSTSVSVWISIDTGTMELALVLVAATKTNDVDASQRF
jgi:hypothetical protein